MKKIVSLASSVAMVASMLIAPLSAGANTLPGNMSAEDFGVVNYDTGLGMLKGYTAGFGVSNNTFAGASSVVVKLYAAGNVLLQTNTAILPKFNADITGTQFSSPFDVSGNFNYATDGYWTNVRATQYGQSVPATKVVATVTLANGKVVTATNTNLSGNPTTIYPTNPPVVDTTPPAVPTHLSPANNTVTNTAGLAMIDWSTVTDPSSPVVYYYESSNSSSLNSNGSFVSPIYQSGALSDSNIATLGTPNGIYYWHVRAVDNAGNSSAWSSAWKVTVSNSPNNPPLIGPPTDKNQCKNNGWKTFNNPVFKNQGQCVSSVVSNGNNNDDDDDDDRANKKSVLAAARAERAAALVEARATFNSEVNSAAATRDSALNAARIERDTALATAATIRSSALNAARLITDREDRQDALQSARDAYQTARKEAQDDYKDAAKSARDTYQAARETARDNYTAAVKSANDAFKQATQ